ncbi:MAG: hypothetical protein KGQ66_09700 [Acidobacteriota bacterium]|nr:hypothetical protein [Acidobacteriota bacterium]
MPTTDPVVARRAWSRGHRTVLVVGPDPTDGAEPGDGGRREGPPDRDRPVPPVVFVADPADPGSWAAAAAMEAELEGPVAEPEG